MATNITPQDKHHHILLVTIAAQGQINPARHLAHRLTTTTTIHFTITTPVSSHRRLFPSSDDNTIVINDGSGVSYAAYSDGYDQGFHPGSGDVSLFLTQLALTGSQTLTTLIDSLASLGRPVTCVVYTLLTDWAADVASTLNIPSLLFWIQPATVFAIFHHYFNDVYYNDLIKSHKNNPTYTLNIPGLPPMQIKDLPSTITCTPSDPLLDSYANIMKALQIRKPMRALVNTFYSLESEAIDSMRDHDVHVELIPVGPLMTSEINIDPPAGSKDLFERDGSDYMKWLDSKEKRSVVYISFGSLSRFSSSEMEVLWRGLRESGRPYLWVVRRDVRDQPGDDGRIVQNIVNKLSSNDEKGMVIEWCEQVRVLMHESVGCFVTHCGWNSVTESLVGGVPMVMLPMRMEQATNAKMVEDVWGTGVRVGGVDEIGRALELVMGEGESARVAESWRELAVAAGAEAGDRVFKLLNE